MAFQSSDINSSILGGLSIPFSEGPTTRDSEWKWEMKLEKMQHLSSEQAENYRAMRRNRNSVLWLGWGLGALGVMATVVLPAAEEISAGRVVAGSGLRVGSTGAGSVPATLVREIQHGERVANLVQEAAQLTYESGGLEHAIISTRSGQRLLLKGGAGGMSFENFAVRRVLLHTHPSPTGPSNVDFLMLQQTGQRSSWIYELFGGGLTRFRSP